MNMIPALSHHLSTILTAVADECNEGLKGTDLRGVQLFYLLAVCRDPGLSQDALADRLGVNGSSVTRQIGELQSLGYVERRRNKNDGRQWLVEPTDRAFAVLPLLVEVLGDVQSALMRDMSPEETELFLDLSERVAKNAARRAAKRKKD
jgi:DNA-binding MarR family transcriptional regulator